MIKFGPSGNSQSFYDDGRKATADMPEWLSARGLDAFEYSFGRGVAIGEPTANLIRDKAVEYGIEISVHAPYYINFANPDAQKAANSDKYLLDSLQALKWLGGKRCVFHSGTEGGAPRKEAFGRIYERLSAFALKKKEEGYSDLIVCPETMGKYSQIGDVAEICELVKLDETYYPCIDFGHLNCIMQGALRTADDFEAVIRYMINEIGFEKTSGMHVHFSKIMYTVKGEVKHLTFADDLYGPEFLPLAQTIEKYKLQPYVICESAGTQAEDAKTMRDIYQSVAGKGV